MEKVHIKTCFSIFVPLENRSLSTAHPTPVSEPTFGLSLFDDQNRPIFLTIRLFYKQRLTSKEDEQQDCLCWAARTPIRQQGDEQQRQSGLLLQLKVKQGVFDFRKVEKIFIRLQVDCTNSEGQIINSAVSKFVQLLPRKRTVDKIGGTNTEVVIPVQWHNINTSYSVDNSAIERANNNYGSDELVSEAIQLLHRAREESEERHHDQLESSVSISGDNMEYALPSSEESEHDHFILQTNAVLHGEVADSDSQYMVLYNGNAEVIGNFRALNFYKASDINIKEDIRLLVEDRDPRDVLLKIDGVSYKFKKGTTHSTNKRFVGYIAQQIESVVPEAVQLIDGILHVDYESLIPYLSESIKQNYDDINNIKSGQQRIEAIVDILYNDFLKRERATSADKSSSTGTSKDMCTPPRVLLIILSIVLTVSVLMVGLYFVVDMSIDDNLPSPSPTQILVPSEIPVPQLPPLPAVTPTSTPLSSSSPLPSVITPPLAPENPDEEALKDIYQATNGNDWNFDRGYDWLSSAPFCQWGGITCDEDKQVTEIILDSNNLHGSITESIGKLERLQYLRMSRNNLTGTIPSAIGQLKALRLVDLSENPHLSGTIPDMPTSLREFTASQCNLSGAIPPSIINMTELDSLRLNCNQLTGTIPPFPSKLRVIILNNNRLEGTLPKFESKVLVWLEVSNNSLSGTLENLANIQLPELRLSNNKFSGEVHMFNMTVPHTLLIDNNQFTSCNQTTLAVDHLCACNAVGNPFRCPIPKWLKKRCQAKCT